MKLHYFQQPQADPDEQVPGVECEHCAETPTESATK